MERRVQLHKKRSRGMAFLAASIFAMVVMLCGSCRTALLPPPQALPPPPPKARTMRVRILAYERNDKLQQINRFEKEELDRGRNGTAVCRKVVTSDVDTGDKAGVQMKINLKAKPRASSSATTTLQGKPEFLPEFFLNRLKRCSTSDAFTNREYPVGNGKALQFAYIIMPGSMESSHMNKSSEIAGIFPLIIGQNVTYAVLSHAHYFEFIPLEELNSRKTESDLVGLCEVVLTTFAVMIIAIYINGRSSRFLVKIVYAVAFVLLASKHVQSVPAAIPEVVPLTLGDSYNTFFDLMHNRLEANTQEVDGHFILPEEMDMNDGERPTRWISVLVTGDSVDRTAVMYFRADTIYLVGFMNSVGTLYCTDDAVDMFPLEGCIPLGFKSNYHDLTERPIKSIDLGLFMQEALLGREGALEAANVLAMFQVEIFDPSAVKNAMLTYAIMIAEAMRFRPIGDLVKENWEHSTVLPKELCNLPFVWQDLSIVWCRHDRITAAEPEWNRAIERLGNAFIRNEHDVDMALDLVKGEKQCLPLRIENPP